MFVSHVNTVSDVIFSDLVLKLSPGKTIGEWKEGVSNDLGILLFTSPEIGVLEWGEDNADQGLSWKWEL